MRDIKKNNVENKFMKTLRIFLWVIFFPILFVLMIFYLIKKHKRKKDNREKIKVFQMSQIDTLSGKDFERVLKVIFEMQGYKVSLTKNTGDFGVDLICEKGNKSLLVQAKRYNHTVGVRAIQEIIASKNHYNCENLMVITNNYFSKEANILAVENNVILADRTVLEKMLSKYDVYFEREELKYSVLTDSQKMEIEKKYRYWI